MWLKYGLTGPPKNVWVDVYDEVRLIYIFLQHLHYLKELLSKKKLQSVSAGADFPTGIQFWVFT